MKNVTLLFIFGCFFSIGVVNAASFDCNKALNSVEKLICSDSSLSSLDDQLSAVYRSLSSQEKKTLQGEQLKWMKQRNVCTDTGCIHAAYVERLDALKKKNDTISDPGESKTTGPLNEIFKLDDYRPEYSSIRFRNGKLYFSQFGPSGNNYDILSYDFSNPPQYLVRERPDAEFVAINEKYLIISENFPSARKISVLDRKSGQPLGSIKLKTGILWAEIRDEKLVAIQGGRIGGGYAANTPALIFELPSLKIMKTTEITGGNDAILWKDKIISLGQEIGIYDLELNKLANLQLPLKKQGFGNSCGNGPLSLGQNNLFVVADCGDISAYDLETFKLKYTLPALANFASIAVIDDLLFVSPLDKKGGHVHIYNADSGKELSIEPIHGQYVFANKDRLLSLEFNFAKTSPIWVYEIAKNEIRSGNRMLSRVVSECAKAREAANQGDIYRAIALCEEGGIRAAIKNTENAASIKPFIKDYGIWLSQTLSRYSEAVTILENFISNNDVFVEEALGQSRLKTKIFSGQPNYSQISDKEKTTKFGQIALLPPPNSKEISIDFGAFNNLFYFSSDRVYVGEWDCSPGDGVALNVYERTTFKFIQKLSIFGCDDEYQDSIESITSDHSKIYLSIGYRYESPDRTDFISINKQTLATELEAHIGTGTLFFSEGKLFSCECGSSSSCISINPSTLARHDEPLECQNNGYADEAKLKLPSSNSTLNTVKALAQGDIENASPRSGYPKAEVVGGDRGVTAQIVVTLNQSASPRIIADLKTLPNAGAALLINANHLFIGNGRDLLIYDLHDFRLHRYIKDFIPEGFANNGFGVDTNGISRLLVDRGQLLVLTFNGQHSRLMDLKEI